MTILLSHNTARRYWEYVGASGKRGMVDGDPVLRAASGRKSAIERCGIDLLGESGQRPVWLEPPIDLMVPTDGRRGRLQYASNHMCAARLPPASVKRVGPDAYVTCPELTFINLGKTLGIPALVQYAMELCGGYALTPWSEMGFEPRSPLCAVERLDKFVRACEGIHGSRRAAAALGLASEGARSPAEVLLYLFLSLPRSMFGYGLPRPLLNQRIEIDRDAQLRLGAEYLVVDLLFADQKLVIEYDSRAFHNTPTRLDHDDDRREVLQEMGYDVVVVRAERLANYRRFDNLVRFTIGKKLGIEVPALDSRFVRGILNLRDDLQ
ncbi:MAG: endonuclease domain-containing protein [Olsenella sp.]|jgi:hypothetical protein|nr:endonuclease domain-containing protein [Olsenella sp.]